MSVSLVQSGLPDRHHFFFGTFAPFLRASDKPIAIACLRLFTFPPLPPLPDLSSAFFPVHRTFNSFPCTLAIFTATTLFFWHCASLIKVRSVPSLLRCSTFKYSLSPPFARDQRNPARDSTISIGIWKESLSIVRDIHRKGEAR